MTLSRSTEVRRGGRADRQHLRPATIHTARLKRPRATKEARERIDALSHGGKPVVDIVMTVDVSTEIVKRRKRALGLVRPKTHGQKRGPKGLSPR